MLYDVKTLDPRVELKTLASLKKKYASEHTQFCAILRYVLQMYSTGQPGVQSYAQPVPNDGSPHHQMHSYSSAGYAIPQTVSMPPGATPGAVGLPPGSQMPGGLQGYPASMQGVPGAPVGGYINAPSGQVSYAVQGGFQPALQQTSGAPVPFQPGTTPGQPAPQMYITSSAAPGQNQPPQPALEYQPYNMQGSVQFLFLLIMPSLTNFT
jgi:hypothetical protein